MHKVDEMLLGESTPTSGAVEYKHLSGDKLSQRTLENWAGSGWRLMHHNCSEKDIHYYIFKRRKG